MNKVKRLADLLNVIMYAFCVSIAGLFLLDATMNADQPVGLLLAGAFLILLASYCLRAFVKKMPVFVGAHVLLFAVTIFVATLMNTPYTKAVAILWVIFCGCMILADIVFWMNAIRDEKSLPVSETGRAIEGFVPIYKEGLLYLPLLFVGIFVLALAFALYAEKPYYGRMAYVLGVLYIGLYFLRSYFRKMSELIRDMGRETGEHQPRILWANARLALPCIGVSILAMVLIQSDTVIRFIEQSLLWLMKTIGWIALIILFFIVRHFRSDPTYGVPIGKKQMPEAISEAPAWVAVFDRIVEYGLTILFIGVVLYFLIKGISFFIRKFSGRSINRLKKDKYADMTEVRERIGRGEHGRRYRERMPKDNAGKVRRMYKGFIRSQVKKGLVLTPSKTPLESVEDLEESTGRTAADLVDITSIYNKARYSVEEIQAQDVARMEELT